jgi:pyruvate/2-oxoglutarate dehydrogenase complex dihydrolipoamide dehydrogenase (E3) component
VNTTNSQPEEYDLLVLGSGEAGKYVAWTMAKKGLNTAVIERKYIGGSCPNIACLPSKNIIHAAKVASYFRRSEEFGILHGDWSIDMAAVRERKRKMVAGLVDMHLDIYQKSGAKLISGSGQFVGAKTIEVTLSSGAKRVLRGKRIVINTGTRAAMDSTPGVEEAEALTHIEALELDRVPEHLLILGGGYVGLEFAQALRRLGSQVTVLERNSRLLRKEDSDVSDALETLFKDEGIQVETNARIARVEGKSGESVTIVASVGGLDRTLKGSHLLVATGRKPNTDNIGLELAGVEVNERGYIKVNERLETTAPDIWAVGDCAGSPHFTHIAFDDFRVVRANLSGSSRVTTGRLVPFCMFTDPEFARVGFSETEAKAAGVAYRLAKIPMLNVLRTRTISETRGFMKTLIDERSYKILGFSVFGAGAGEIIAAVQVAMIAGLPYTALRDAIFTHPTLPEGLIPLFSNVPPAQDNKL